MRWLAVARYRYLILLRRTKWIIPVLVLTLLPSVMAGAPGLLFTAREYRREAPVFLRGAGLAVVFAYSIHIWALTSLCWSFGVVPRRPEGARPLDLMDSAPISGYSRYWGDAIGILAAALTIHVSTLPLLALIIAQSAFPRSAFWYLEAAVVFILFFASAVASWTLRAKDSKWSQTRSARNAGAVLLTLLLIIMASTRVDQFSDAVVAFFVEPSPRAWNALTATFRSGTLLFVLLTLSLGMFVALYSRQSARSIDHT
jgi:hypothetical protein